MDYYELLQLIASQDYIKGSVFSGIDVDNQIYVYIDGLDALRNKQIYIDLTGRGISLNDASYEYIKMLINTSYILRSRKSRGYISHKIRTFVKVFAHFPYGLLPYKEEPYDE